MSKEEMIAAITAKDPFRVVAFEDEDGLRKLYNEVVGDVPDSPADFASLTPNISDDKTKITIYHGSEFVIKEPAYGKGKRYNDYGLGFYTTQNINLAGEWAVLSTGRDGYINEYAFNSSDLTTLALDTLDIKHWAAILMDNRRGTYKHRLISPRIQRFKEKFLIDISNYDIITGWRADDAYFSFVEDFMSGFLSLENLQKAMKFGDLGQQVCIKSQLSFERLIYSAHYPAPVSQFLEPAENRDRKARRDYFDLAGSESSLKGTLITDIVGR